LEDPRRGHLVGDGDPFAHGTGREHDDHHTVDHESPQIRRIVHLQKRPPPDRFSSLTRFLDPPTAAPKETSDSRYNRDLGIGRYEEVRDSGANFFFEWLPAGKHTSKYRLRANMAGAFRVGPATLQSMSPSEFTTYSAGHLLEVDER
jgi:hypothetical protein